MVPLYSIDLGGNAIESFVGSILTVVLHKTMIHNIVTKLHCMGLLLDESAKRHVLTEGKLQLEVSQKNLLHFLALQ